jgi:hypothetical protein
MLQVNDNRGAGAAPAARDRDGNYEMQRMDGNRGAGAAPGMRDRNEMQINDNRAPVVRDRNDNQHHPVGYFARYLILALWFLLFVVALTFIVFDYIAITKNNMPPQTVIASRTSFQFMAIWTTINLLFLFIFGTICLFKWSTYFGIGYTAAALFFVAQACLTHLSACCIVFFHALHTLKFHLCHTNTSTHDRWS